jgi:hypothetical protein
MPSLLIEPRRPTCFGDAANEELRRRPKPRLGPHSLLLTDDQLDPFERGETAHVGPHAGTVGRSDPHTRPDPVRDKPSPFQTISPYANRNTAPPARPSTDRLNWRLEREETAPKGGTLRTGNPFPHEQELDEGDELRVKLPDGTRKAKIKLERKPLADSLAPQHEPKPHPEQDAFQIFSLDDAARWVTGRHGNLNHSDATRALMGQHPEVEACEMYSKTPSPSFRHDTLSRWAKKYHTALSRSPVRLCDPSSFGLMLMRG